MKATYRDHGGTDLSVVNAARVSFNGVSSWDYYNAPADMPYDEYEDKCRELRAKGWTQISDDGLWQGLKSKDVNLINYLARGMPRAEWEKVIRSIMEDGYMHGAGGELYENQSYNIVQHKIEDLMLMAQHWVPFTHTMITLHMVAPVPIARQFFKHKIGFTESEESRRYVDDGVSLYIPSEFRETAENIKQGSGGAHPQSADWIKTYKAQCYEAINTYDRMIKAGIAPEQARFVLPQGIEVQWIWTGNLASFARVYNQRTDSHAQLESQQLASQLDAIIRPLFPVSWDALVRSKRTE